MDVKIGDKYKGKVNGKTFEVTGIEEEHDTIFYKCEGNNYHYGLDAFKRCLLERLED